MRAAVLQLAFAGLGALEAQTSAWHDNPASQRVSLRLGYVHEGQQLLARRGEPTRAPALPAHARGVAAQPLRRRSRSTTSSPACRCSALHELAPNLYNHAIMAAPTTQRSRQRRRLARADRRHCGRIGLRGARARAAHRRASAALPAHRAGALRGLRRALARGTRALRRRLPLPAARREPPVRRGGRAQRHARRRSRLRLPARSRLGLRADGGVPAGRARLPPDRESRLLRDGRHARAGAAGRGRACWTRRSPSTASPASRARVASRPSSRT